MQAEKYHVVRGSVYALYEIDHNGHLQTRNVTHREWADAHAQGSGTDRHGALSWACRRCGDRHTATIVRNNPLTIAAELHRCAPAGAPVRTYVPLLPLAQARP